MLLFPMSLQSTVVPTANQSVIVFDSTRFPSGPVTSTAVSSGSTFLAPGTDRGQMTRAVVSVTCQCTTNNVTILYEILTGVAGTSADWEAQGSTGSQTVTAGTTHIFEFKPLAADWRVRVLAGGSAPGALTVKLNAINPTTDYGN